ncbi:MAG: phosphoglycerate dehydrogenase [Rhodospirillales bacterium]|nr:phosphoglycerate dehydrogenase [Rhodospirillales bacterium]MBO6787310.1 phosphoglycerate dehydrogenase [Rhodospirillales bacterium]
MTAIQNPSLSKDKIKVLLLEGISDSAVETFRKAGYDNIERVSTALDGDALIEALQDTRILGIRSRTQITRDVLDATDRLVAVGCFSVGTNQIDLNAAQRRGVPVFNAPFSNTRSVAELTIAEIVMLFRRTFPRSVAAHAGGWEKSAAGSREVRGKTLGIVGYGNIGTQLSMLAEAMGMNVIYYDHTDKLRHGNVEPTASLAELLAEADVVSLHVPDTEATRGMIGADEIKLMKTGAYLINNARGKVVDIDALAGALTSGHLAGAAIDVFPSEPGSNKETFTSPLQGLDNVILTPHVGGSTEEAQERIGEEVARKLADYSDIGTTVGAVNFPQVLLPPRPAGTRFLQVQKNLPGELGHLNEVFARHGTNIAGQYYQTEGDIGYVVLDADGADSQPEDILADIRALDGTIRARLVHRIE